MIESKHTPGPWQIAKDNYGVERIWDSQLDCDIACCEGDGSIPHEQRQANAGFIVQACNSHDSMVKALEAAKVAILNVEAQASLCIGQIGTTFGARTWLRNEVGREAKGGIEQIEAALTAAGKKISDDNEKAKA